ncbi:MAG: MFS transporter [Candidatus Bathyarchaeia archaeon]|jgi:MFS family permease
MTEGGSSTKHEFGIGLLRGNLLWLVVCGCIWQFTTNIPVTYLPLYIQKLGGSPIDIGFVKSAAALAGLFLYPIGGYIADKQGRVRLVSLATFIYAFSFIPFAYAPNWETLAFASFFQSLVLFYAPILTVLMADSMPAGMRGQGFALAITIPAALGVISPFIGGYLVDKMGIIPAMNAIYLGGFGAGIVVAFLRLATLKETLDPSQVQKINYRDFFGFLKDSYGSFIDTLKWMPPEVRALAVLQVMQIFFIGIASSFWVVYATTIIGVSAVFWGLTSALQGGVNMLFALPAGKLMDRIGRKKLLIPILALAPLFPIAFLFIHNSNVLLAFVVSVAVVNAFLLPGFQSLLADYTPRNRRGRVISAVGSGAFVLDIQGNIWGGGMLLFIPLAIAQIIGGALYEFAPSLPFIMTAVGLIPVAIYARYRVSDPRKIEA